MKRVDHGQHVRSGYFSRRWHGEIPSSVLLWRDMVAIGTLINVAMSVAALLLLANGAEIAVAVIVHFLPLPYNVFLVMAFWRSGQRTNVTSAIALLWLGAVILI